VKLQINKAHFPVTALGPGRRIGIWTQGCSIRCAGCVSRDTWEPDPGKALAIDELLAWCRMASADRLDGVTISGGEPFEQPGALDALLDALHGWRSTLAEPFDILCYSGFGLARLQRRHAGILAKLDAVLAEPFVEDEPTDLAWRGSANQRLVPLTALGEARYADWVNGAVEGARRFQMVTDANRVWFVGVPRRGEMAYLETACEQRGLSLGAASWRA
jgi:anaerobic ribonucleoside-triphosphate reductase activating protein